MKKVVILQRITGNYRLPLFEYMFKELSNQNIELKVIYGQAGPDEKEIGVVNGVFLSKIQNHYVKFRSKYLIFQFPIKDFLTADMIIIQQGNKIVTNHLYIILSYFLRKKIGVWGNCKQELGAFRNGIFYRTWWWKLTKNIDHWFAYNDTTKLILEKAMFPKKQITVLYNTIDTKSQIETYNSFTESYIQQLKNKYEIKSNDIVGLFCSRLYPDKRIDFLLQALELVIKEIPNFKFFVLGDGDEIQKISDFEVNHKWFFQIGTKYGEEKISYFRISDFQLMPGALGLHVVDSFAFETPIITTNNLTHGVEFDYLQNYENGIVSSYNLDAYVEAIIKVCKDSNLLKKLKYGCKESAKLFSIERMSQNFISGILETINK